MAGVVAMASVIEDFEIQPCKKSHKDGGSPVAKTITNYFAPVPKPVEKPFSPPRSNNIMDYFNRKAPSSREKTSTPEQSKENCQTSQPAEKHTTPEGTLKQPGRSSQKQGRKPSKAARKLQDLEAVHSTKEVCLVVDEPDSSRDSAGQSASSSGILGSDTAALLAQLSVDTCTADRISQGNDTKTVSVEQAQKDEHHEDASTCGVHIQLKPELNCNNLSPIAPPKDKVKRAKPAMRNPRKRQPPKAEQSEPEGKEAEKSLCDISMEVNVDKASQVNTSTITISFEDFLQSQNQGEGEEEMEQKDARGEESKITTEAEEMETDQLNTPIADEKVASEEPSLQVSPRTLTIQAEVHAVSPKQEAVMAVGKVASIFSRRKGATSEVTLSPPSQVRHQLPPLSLTLKRKSNVVLQEEDLELDVVESESTPKCCQADRKQFMAAFKQPSMDGAKTKPGKIQGKQKQPAEKTSQAGDKEAKEDTVIVQSVEQHSAACPENKGAKQKLARKGKNKARENEEAVITSPAAATQVEPVAMSVEADAITEEPTTTSGTTIPTVRRSRRKALSRQAPEAMAATPVQKTRNQDRSEDAALPQDSPLQISTPKTHKSKHSVFMAELVCPADKKGSPIRIKFTRVHKKKSKSQAESDFQILSPLDTKISTASNRRNQAKKLVEKAKVIQQSKKTAIEVKSTLRRSSRSQTSTKKSYCEDEDSVICLEEDKTATVQMVAGKGKSQQLLRSLNDVLGKSTSVSKETKTPLGSKVAPLSQEKKAQRASMVVSIFDESSREGSENSQDDEQFRARREFLKSGLPDSFRKQIAKTAATKEAYSLSCSSFQPVIHMLQRSQDCPLWSLPWPESSFLCHLKELWCPPPEPLPSLNDSFGFKTEPASRAFCERGSGWRQELSECVRRLLVEEVSTSNPAFPVQRFLSRFLKRRTDHLQQCTASEPEAVTRVTSTQLSAEPVGGKRKRKDEGEMTGKVAKKQRSNHSGEIASTSEPAKRGSRMRQALRHRLEKEEGKDKAKPLAEAIPSQDDSVVVLDEDDLPLGGNSGKEDMVKEDVLWTDKYQPQHSSDIIGNTASVRRLHSWLKEWKVRADREERKKQKEKKREEGSNDSDWDCGEEDSQDGEDMLCNTLLITGPTGVGKTAAVYACAQELGFKVFEVNASSQRSGRLILSQLKEATQSHQVDIHGVNAHKPTYFNSCSSAGTIRPGSSPRKVNSPRRVACSPRKHPQSPRGAKRGCLAPTSLANFFKVGRPTNKEPTNTDKTQQTTAPKKTIKAKELASRCKELAVTISPITTTTPKGTPSEEQSKKTATSLILFEEVDVIFDDDAGFLAAIKTFMTTTKRPVILTTSDPAFSTMFDGNFEEIHFKTPSVLNVGSYLQLLCVAEDVRTDPRDVSSLLSLNGCDIRQSLLQLQFWTRSARGRHITRPLERLGSNVELKPETPGEAADSSLCGVAIPPTLPPCDTGCTESMLGLLNIEPERDLQELLRNPCPVKSAVCRELLTNCRRRGVDLLYSNMETLLPLPLTQLTIPTHKPQQSVSVTQDQLCIDSKELPSNCTQPDTLLSHARLLQTAELGSDDGSPVKVSNRMKKNKKRHCIPDQDPLHSDSDSEDGFLSLCKPPSAPHATVEVKECPVEDVEMAPPLAPRRVKREPLTPEQRAKSVPVSHCLESIADFLDHMSYLDSSLLLRPSPQGADAYRGTFPFSVCTAVKDGMTDEPREEFDRGSWTEGEWVFEIQAAVEALSFQRCRVAVAESWDKAQALEVELGKEAAAELTLPVPPHREGFSLTQDSPCQPKLVQQRREVMESLVSRGVFGTLGNRPAAALDYLPALRTICKSEQLKEQGKVKRRFLHYLDAIHLGLSKSTLQHLAEDFP